MRKPTILIIAVILLGFAICMGVLYSIKIPDPFISRHRGEHIVFTPHQGYSNSTTQNIQQGPSPNSVSQREPGCDADLGRINIASSPDQIELWIEDPNGKATGIREGTNVEEIPQSASQTLGLADEETGQDEGSSHQIQIQNPQKGSYSIHVTSKDDFIYSSKIVIFGCNGESQSLSQMEFQLNRGQKQKFILIYDPLSTSKLGVPNSQ